jgi:hypothetical protein
MKINKLAFSVSGTNAQIFINDEMLFDFELTDSQIENLDTEEVSENHPLTAIDCLDELFRIQLDVDTDEELENFIEDLRYLPNDMDVQICHINGKSEDVRIWAETLFNR